MDVRQQDVERIVVEVLKKMMSDQPTAAATTVVAASGCDCGDFGLFDRLEDAVQAAQAAQKKISTVAMRDKIIAAIRKAGLENAKAFAEIAHNETGMGRVSDKIAKNILVCERTPGTECLSPMAISGDMGLTLIENAPWGVIASVTPSTNPTATVINNAISMIAGGNSVIFAPHPNAKRASQTAIQVLNKAIIEATGVANLLVAVKEPTIEVAQELFSHPRIKLLVVTGGEAVVAQARKVATMRLIAAGAGNPPVVVDETANIARAARSIYDGASFDNNIICADEKEIIAVDSIADQLKAEMKAIGAVEISLEQADAVARVVLRNYPQVEGGKAPNPNPKWVGRDAALIAKAAGIDVPDSCRLLIVDVKRDINHVFARVEQLMPVIPLLRAANVDEAIEWALILERGLSHTAGMHSRNIDNMDKMARAMNTSLFVKNGPHLAALGAGGEGWTTMTISTPTGEGVTCARSFVRLRRCCVVDNFRIV